MIDYSKKIKENCPRKCFWWWEKETRVKILPWVSPNQPSNNWAQDEAIRTMEDWFKDIRNWLVEGRLLHDDDKTEFLVIGTCQQLN